ncbi:MAG TPA: phosphoribosylanthranilate isomerase [Cyanobacteria bacterium UBA11149]|nr:phosphoribosylanthranilate isomerase [Cyanobacteria bacterium UBA11367]HBE56925.1 phosphoribosylanthranilate isomerase [Cyanobacteria bacterium UBA11366]HBK63579.1 phosphoribosylanthranilate isomerase [Cyanobacteria bacterium UBA11166]HBR73448.1 phosphoribosylanthranilate isomerase [Cyanobacteria bacterium UBA11159]HBS69336.1 phosphoribosylanthranilate isomerase [Cyanobacteria bacterium UBA11153]HBW89145.1 phosphoribosylanthranilate isomerase [Cyanobacteria bacterium UBA11149]HCA94532.1 ph
MRIKICGITKPEQGNAIAKLGATALGFICVASSPRYVTPKQIKSIVENLEVSVDKIGVFVNSQIEEICKIVMETGLTGVQLHGNESPEFCTKLRQLLPKIEIIKALRIKTRESLQEADNYANYVDTLLLDAYHPQQLGGTGITLDWQTLAEFPANYPWFLAGGLTPDNILDALKLLKPTGIDLSSGVEVSPGDKDLAKVALLLEAIYE